MIEQRESETKRPSQPQHEAKEDAFDTPAILTITTAHAGHDLYPSFLAPLLPLLIVKLGIPLAAAGLLASVWRAGSLLQPFFGLWADRTDSRYFLIATPTVTALCMSSLGIAPNYLSVAILLAVAGVSTAAFHPTAAATVTRASGRSWGRGSALYMTGGKMGFAIGPLFIVALVTWLGLEMSYIAAIPGVVFSLLLYLQLRKKAAPRIARTSMAGIWNTVKERRRTILLLSGLVVLRSTSMVSIATFYPTYLTGRGSSLIFAGFAMTVYEVAGSVGALAGGTASDRLGRRGVLLFAQLVSGPLLFMAVRWPEGATGLVLLGIAGCMATTSSPVELTLFQELIPGGRSTAAGIWYLLSFEGSLFAAVLVGMLGDSIGLGSALQFSVFASMLSIPLTLALPKPSKSS